MKKVIFIVLIILTTNFLYGEETKVAKGVNNSEVNINPRVVRVECGPFFPQNSFDKLNINDKGFYTAQYRVVFYAAELYLVTYIELVGLFEEEDRKVLNSYFVSIPNYYYENVKIKEWKSFDDVLLEHSEGHLIDIKILGNGEFIIKYDSKETGKNKDSAGGTGSLPAGVAKQQEAIEK